jgi:hypothetical protein
MVQRGYACISAGSANLGTVDLVVTIPFSIVAERFGHKVVLWCNMVPRIFMSVWCLAVGRLPVFCRACGCVADGFQGQLPHALPTNAIIVGPFLAVLGGDCVFNSTVFAITSSFAKEYVQRYNPKAEALHEKLMQCTVPHTSPS